MKKTKKKHFAIFSRLHICIITSWLYITMLNVLNHFAIFSRLHICIITSWLYITMLNVLNHFSELTCSWFTDQQDSTYVYCKHNIQREKRSIFAQLKPVISTVFSSEYIGGDPVHKQRSTELF